MAKRNPPPHDLSLVVYDIIIRNGTGRSNENGESSQIDGESEELQEEHVFHLGVYRLSEGDKWHLRGLPDEIYLGSYKRDRLFEKKSAIREENIPFEELPSKIAQKYDANKVENVSRTTLVYKSFL